MEEQLTATSPNSNSLNFFGQAMAYKVGQHTYWEHSLNHFNHNSTTEHAEETGKYQCRISPKPNPPRAPSWYDRKYTRDKEVQYPLVDVNDEIEDTCCKGEADKVQNLVVDRQGCGELGETKECKYNDNYACEHQKPL